MTKLSAGFTIEFMSIKIFIYVNLDQRIDLAINYGDKLFLIIGPETVTKLFHCKNI